MRPLSYRKGTQCLWNLKWWLAVEACDFEYPVGRQDAPLLVANILYGVPEKDRATPAAQREVSVGRNRACKARVS
jgi:hypothetical protein